MLKIRISGSESELKQIAHKAGNTPIQRFKYNSGKTSFAIDVQISVHDFIENLDLSNDAMHKNDNNNCDTQELKNELQNLLDDLSEE